MRSTTIHHRGGIELSMTPMIDVVFLLLVFFLWTSSFQEPEFDLPGSLAAEPKAGTVERGDKPPPPEMFDEIVIRVIGKNLSSPELTLNGQSIAGLPELSDQLTVIAEMGVQPMVIVDPNEETPIGAAIRVYDAARAVGLQRVLFAAKK